MKPFLYLLAASVALFCIATLAGCSNTKFTDVRIVPYPDGKGGVLYGTNRIEVVRSSTGNKVQVGKFSILGSGSTNGTELRMESVMSDSAQMFIEGMKMGRELGTKAPGQ